MPRHTKRKKDQKDWGITDWENWLWPVFSRFIRLRDCIKTTGTTDWGRCVTCGRKYRFEKLQAGHFVPGRTRAVLFDEKCTHAQCYRCNCHLQGAWPPYFRFMEKEYGREVIDELMNLYGVNAELTPDWFKQLYEYYSWCVGEMSRTGQLVPA